MTKYAYINGNFIDEEQASISVKERGFRFGDGVFETIRIANKHPYQWHLHLARLEKGLKLLKINYDTKDVKIICDELLQKNNLANGFLRLSISRGKGSKGYMPDVKSGPTIVIETMPEITPISDSVDLWFSSYTKISDKSLPSSAKTMQGLNSTLARVEAAENGCFEALLLDNDGYICEGSSGNIFWLEDGVLFTPSLELGVLPGTIRDAVMRLAPYKIKEGQFTLGDLKRADEVFLTNSNWLAVGVKGLKPDETEWKSNKLLGKIRQVILEDIEKQCA